MRLRVHRSPLGIEERKHRGEVLGCEVLHQRADRGHGRREHDVARLARCELDAGQLDDLDLVKPRRGIEVLGHDAKLAPLGGADERLGLDHLQIDLQEGGTIEVARHAHRKLLPLAPRADQGRAHLRALDGLHVCIEHTHHHAGPAVHGIERAHEAGDHVLSAREDRQHAGIEPKRGRATLDMHMHRALARQRRGLVVQRGLVPDRKARPNAEGRVVLGTHPVERDGQRVDAPLFEVERRCDPASNGRSRAVVFPASLLSARGRDAQGAEQARDRLGPRAWVHAGVYRLTTARGMKRGRPRRGRACGGPPPAASANGRRAGFGGLPSR